MIPPAVVTPTTTSNAASVTTTTLGSLSPLQIGPQNNFVWMVSDIPESYLEKICNSSSAREVLLNGGIVLNKGQNVIQGGDNGATVHMDVADVVVPPHGTVVLQTADVSRIGVISLTQAEKGVATITLKGQGTYQIPAGTQIVVELPPSVAFRDDSRGPAYNNHSMQSSPPGAAVRVDSIGPVDQRSTNVGKHNVAVRLDSTGPAAQRQPNGGSNDVAVRLDSTGPAIENQTNGGNNDVAVRLDSTGPAAQRQSNGNGSNNNIAFKLDSVGPAAQRSANGASNNGAFRLDSTGPASQNRSNGGNNNVAVRLDSTAPASQLKTNGGNNDVAMRLDSTGPAAQRSANGANNDVAMRLDSTGPAAQRSANEANNDVAMRLDSAGPAAQRTANGANNDVAMRLDSTGPAAQRNANGAHNDVAMRLDSTGPAPQRNANGANNDVAMRLHSTGPAGQRNANGANVDTAVRLDSTGPAAQRSANGAKNNVAMRLDSTGPAAQRNANGAHNDAAMRLDSTGPAGQRNANGANVDTAVRLDSTGPAAQRLPNGDTIAMVPSAGAGNDLINRENSNAVVVERFPFGDFKDLPGHTNPAASASTSGSDDFAQSQDELPRLMRAIVKMPEEVPKDLIWNSTYHHFRYFLPIHKEGAIGGAMGQEQLSAAPTIQPIAYTTAAIAPHSSIRSAEGKVLMQKESSAYTLDNGSAMFQEEQYARTVITPHGLVEINKGAMVMITVTPLVTYVRDLYDNSSHDVVVRINKFKAELKPGQEVAMVRASKAQVWDAVYSDNVARRDMQVSSIDENTHVAVSDFSHINLMMNNPILQSLRASVDEKDRKTYQKLEKMAAVITTVHDRTRAPYVVPFEPIQTEQVATKEGPQM